jgi:hypothetical protein
MKNDDEHINLAVQPIRESVSGVPGAVQGKASSGDQAGPGGCRGGRLPSSELDSSWRLNSVRGELTVRAAAAALIEVELHVVCRLNGILTGGVIRRIEDYLAVHNGKQDPG